MAGGSENRSHSKCANLDNRALRFLPPSQPVHWNLALRFCPPLKLCIGHYLRQGEKISCALKICPPRNLRATEILPPPFPWRTLCVDWKNKQPNLLTTSTQKEKFKSQCTKRDISYRSAYMTLYITLLHRLLYQYRQKVQAITHKWLPCLQMDHNKLTLVKTDKRAILNNSAHPINYGPPYRQSSRDINLGLSIIILLQGRKKFISSE